MTASKDKQRVEWQVTTTGHMMAKRSSLPLKGPVDDAFIDPPYEADPTDPTPSRAPGRATYLVTIRLTEIEKHFETENEAVAFVEKVIATDPWAEDPSSLLGRDDG